MAEEMNKWFADVLNGLGNGEYTLRNTADGSIMDLTVDRANGICPVFLVVGRVCIPGHSFEAGKQDTVHLKACDELFNVTACTISCKDAWTIEKVTA